MSLFLRTPFPFISPVLSKSQTGVVPIRSAMSSPEKKTRRKKQQRRQQKHGDSLLSTNGSVVSAAEQGLRLIFMEELMQHARNRDAPRVNDVIYDMIAAGLSPGPRSFHGLVVAYTLNGDHEGAMHSLKRELSTGVRPLHETLIALARLFGSKGLATKGLEILAAMEKINYDIRQAWLILVEELVRNKYLEDANKVFLRGAKGGLRATDEIYDLMIAEDCKAGDHSNALEIAYEMEAAGRMATTFHFNHLLSCQATCGIPEVAFATFENMEYGEGQVFLFTFYCPFVPDYMKPDTETYNWVIQAYTRAESYDRVQDVAELLGMMFEDHKRLQPNVKTYALLVECFTKYCAVTEAIRHFRALQNYEGGTKVLHNEGNFGDPLSLYLRALCREGRIIELLEALEAMAKDNQPVPPRAMILSRKYRTLVSSWIEPLQEEAELGYEIDYIARYISEGGLTGERKRWVPRRGKTPLDPDAVGFIYSNPMETSFKQRCLEDGKKYHRKLLRTLQNEGPAVLGDVSESDYVRVEERLKKLIKGPEQHVLKPKAASKMVVSELKEELDAQGLPTDGTRNVLYQRVQKARRINRSRGRPLWVPPVEEEEEEVDEEVDELISRIKLEEGNTEFWKRRFLGEGLNGRHDKAVEMDESELSDVLDDDVTDVEYVAKDEEADEEADEEEEVEQAEPESQDVDRVKEKLVEAKKPLQMIGVQLLKDSDQTTTTSKRSMKRSSRMVEDDDDEDWFPEDPFEAFKEMRKRKVFDVIELGGMPTIGDCAVIIHAAIRAPLPSAFLKILQKTHSLGYVFGRSICQIRSNVVINSSCLWCSTRRRGKEVFAVGVVSPLYDEIISLCLDLGELDAAVAIVADMETTGIAVPDQTLDRVITARQTGETSVDDASS
ncbi:SAP domain-containing protein [Citrus sinensis]|uniref:SAP domain-containing protein n=1 Tax=Citrus sinensis TaxID=2711 RepID=A0ACB8MF20_CITSI|nr:SAP domain-containing protein [Citrus sinensis]